MAAEVGTGSPWLTRVLVATDRSQTADTAVRWAANMVGASQAELILLQVLVPEAGDGGGRRCARGDGAPGRGGAGAGPRGRWRVRVLGGGWWWTATRPPRSWMR